ncbi:hypothetical protein SAMN04489806_2286 [Paramicrobacterium humi]|uniref:Uncharacterized protein n=1 Tax=Paramicrobacterium humi TaxID=640635 RepID=A0A1H4NRW6_9MICO|nr:hypothetical protein [Microbacterium humi]SEB97967.1 hypothetical protein SAMN04489806_2286 [Microbacterium humi]
MDSTSGADWIEHRRPDGELVGWIRMAGDDFVPIDLLGREIGGPGDWLSAEERLEALGIGYLAEPWRLELAPGRHIRVRLTEVSRDGIRAKLDDFGAIDVPLQSYDLGFPAPDALREWGEESGIWPFS